MLRRKPTALTITNEDIAAFEEAYLRRLAYARYLKTGEDPEGLFRNNKNGAAGPDGTAATTTTSGGDAGAGAQVAVDPNDELKPLPGDKARIVRSREERIMGAGGGAR
ncbi:uncharacterized protein PV07_11744 [Cladophialophora immunda]|uniref:Uncharacterized protein n=1 Tax=Cladophialophora immunda TaxID=569365 RepID=A0A0D2BZ26_9EURO|nr:uncharacterized protein PV07_11744 [Cladophialophora immunda]KIW23555.1 hypothetical protein PV07_11744 [Cladophialophora immunda]OQV09217.1 hypothetical protein CLAIMM_13363 [Cladophialophora immunda]